MPEAQGMITLLVAKKVISNIIKGNPALKPDHGEHGQCSWFVSSGDPYTGVSADKNIAIEVEVEHHNVVKDDNIVKDTLASFKQHEMALLQSNRRQFDLHLWNTVGNKLRIQRPFKCSNILVPQGPVSQQGAGYFLVVPPLASPLVKVTNLDALINTVEQRDPGFVDRCKQAEEDKKKLSPIITVEIGPCAAASGIAPVWAKVKNAYGNPDKAVGASPTTKALQIKSGWGGQTSNVTRYFQTYSLTYPSFREARNAFKSLMALAADMARGGSEAAILKVFGGSDWSEKQKSVYTAPGQDRFRFTA